MSSITNDVGYPVGEHDARCPVWGNDDPDTCDCRDEQGKTPRPWPEGPMALFDLETTGPDPLDARIVTATVVLHRGKTTERKVWLADPGVDIPDGAAAIHGITTEYARQHGRPATEVITDVARALTAAWTAGTPVVGYNVTYDLTVMAAECARHDLPRFECSGPVIDGRVLDQHVDRYRKGKRTLTDAAAHYAVRLDGAHDATEDALAAGRIVWRIAQRYPHIGRLTLAELHDRQARAHAEAQHRFADYLLGHKVMGRVTDPRRAGEHRGPRPADPRHRRPVADPVRRGCSVNGRQCARAVVSNALAGALAQAYGYVPVSVREELAEQVCARIEEMAPRPEVPTRDDVRADPAYWIAGAGYYAARRAECAHGYRLTDSCPGCDAEDDQPRGGAR